MLSEQFGRVYQIELGIERHEGGGWIVTASWDCQIMFIIIVLSHLIAVGLTNNPSIANITMDMWGPYNANE